VGGAVLAAWSGLPGGVRTAAADARYNLSSLGSFLLTPSDVGHPLDVTLTPGPASWLVLATGGLGLLLRGGRRVPRRASA
jgi:hypothetical protein